VIERGENWVIVDRRRMRRSRHRNPRASLGRVEGWPDLSGECCFVETLAKLPGAGDQSPRVVRPLQPPGYGEGGPGDLAGH